MSTITTVKKDFRELKPGQAFEVNGQWFITTHLPASSDGLPAIKIGYLAAEQTPPFSGTYEREQGVAPAPEQAVSVLK